MTERAQKQHRLRATGVTTNCQATAEKALSDGENAYKPIFRRDDLVDVVCLGRCLVRYEKPPFLIVKKADGRIAEVPRIAAVRFRNKLRTNRR